MRMINGKQAPAVFIQRLEYLKLFERVNLVSIRTMEDVGRGKDSHAHTINITNQCS